MSAADGLTGVESTSDTPRCSLRQHLLNLQYVPLMTERERIMAAFEKAGVVDGLRWAFSSAADRTAADFDADTGHDTAWVGFTRWTLLRDRLDRVFSCRKYAIQVGAPADAGLDLLYAGLNDQDIATLPAIDPTLVKRDDALGSPGWVFNGVRWLLASGETGHIDDLPWNQKSPTKQRVASQPDPDDADGTLFDEILSDPVVIAMMQARDEARSLDMPTLVLAHAQSVETNVRELVIGLPSLDECEGKTWKWNKSLLGSTPTSGGTKTTPSPKPDAPDDVPDATVRLRPPVADAKPDVAPGQ